MSVGTRWNYYGEGWSKRAVKKLKTPTELGRYRTIKTICVPKLMYILNLRSTVNSLPKRHVLMMHNPFGVKKDNEHDLHLRFPRSSLLGVRRWRRMTLGTLYPRLGVVFKEPGFIPGNNVVQEVGPICTQLLYFLTNCDTTVLLFDTQNFRHIFFAYLAHEQVLRHKPMNTWFRHV